MTKNANKAVAVQPVAEEPIHLSIAQASQINSLSKSPYADFIDRMRKQFGPAFEQVVDAHQEHGSGRNRLAENLEGETEKTLIHSYWHANTLMVKLTKKDDPNINITFNGEQRTDKRAFRMANVYKCDGYEREFVDMIAEVTEKLADKPEKTLQPSETPFPK